MGIKWRQFCIILKTIDVGDKYSKWEEQKSNEAIQSTVTSAAADFYDEQLETPPNTKTLEKQF